MDLDNSECLYLLIFLTLAGEARGDTTVEVSEKSVAINPLSSKFSGASSASTPCIKTIIPSGFLFWKILQIYKMRTLSGK